MEANAGLHIAEVGSAYRNPDPYRMSIEEYLEYEKRCHNRHEYLAGEIFAMNGVTPRHDRIAGNVFSSLRAHLRGGPCEAYVSGVKVRLKARYDEYIYYPDVVVACEYEPEDEHCLTNPKLIVEVLSFYTEGIDRHEKEVHYRWIDKLEEYVVVAQDKPEVTLHRRSESWRPVVFASVDAALELHSIGLSLPLAEIYANETLDALAAG